MHVKHVPTIQQSDFGRVHTYLREINLIEFECFHLRYGDSALETIL